MGNSNSLIDDYAQQVLIMRTKDGFYPIRAYGKKPLKEEAADHGRLNDHLTSIEDVEGNTLWQRTEGSE